MPLKVLATEGFYLAAAIKANTRSDYNTAATQCYRDKLKAEVTTLYQLVMENSLKALGK